MFKKIQQKNAQASKGPAPVEELSVPKTDWSKITPTHDGPRPTTQPSTPCMPASPRTFVLSNGVAFQRLLGRIYIRSGRYTEKHKGELAYVHPKMFPEKIFINKSDVVLRWSRKKKSFMPGELVMQGEQITWTGDEERYQANIDRLTVHNDVNDARYVELEPATFGPNTFRLVTNISDYNHQEVFRFSTPGDFMAWQYSMLHNIALGFMSDHKKKTAIDDLCLKIRSKFDIEGIDWDLVFDQLYTE